MNTLEFKELLDDTHRMMCLLTSTKGVEYANSDDQFANFKRLGKELDMDPERVLWVQFTKHLDAIRSYLRARVVLSEPIEGRIDDAILYLILLKGLIQERGRVPVGVPEHSQMEPDPDSKSPRVSSPLRPGPELFRVSDRWMGRGEVVIGPNPPRPNTLPPR